MLRRSLAQADGQRWNVISLNNNCASCICAVGAVAALNSTHRHGEHTRRMPRQVGAREGTDHSA